MVSEQAALCFGSEYEVSEDWRELRALLDEAAGLIGKKVVAADLGINPSDLANALAGRDRHPFKAEWIAYLIRKAPDLRILEWLCALRGCRVEPVEKLSPEERCRLYEAEIERRYTGEERERFYSSALGRPSLAKRHARPR